MSFFHQMKTLALGEFEFPKMSRRSAREFLLQLIVTQVECLLGAKLPGYLTNPTILCGGR